MAGWVPGAVPAPLQAVQRTAVSTVMSFVVAEDGLVELELDGISASRPARVRLRGPRVAAPPKKASMMSPSPPKPAPPKRAARAAAAGVERVAAEVDDAALLRVGQRLVGAGDLLEALLGARVGVDVGVQVAGHLAGRRA